MATRARTIDLLLRDVTEEDLPILFQHQLDPEAIDMAAFPPRDWRAFTAHWTKILGDERVETKTIVFQGQVAGNVLCFESSGKPHVGYWIGSEFWGRGVATEALSQFTRNLTTRPLYARVAKANGASIRVLEKCGFAVTGEDVSSARGVTAEELIMELTAPAAR